MAARYETIGRTYSATRRADPRIAARLHAALGDAARVVNVGAGTGSYEPAGRAVVAVDPSPTMLRQRPPGAAPALLGVAEALPIPDGAFDAALAVLTLHHWQDLARGCAEMRRVARRQVVFFFERSWVSRLWLVTEYFPEIAALESERHAPGTAQIARHLDVVHVEAVPVPADCTDGFGGCFWNRPEAYLDPTVQAGISSFSRLDAAARALGTERLRRDLESGEWDARHGHLRSLPERDLGYRVLTAGVA
jgi:SAM-dependent methyltransferase